jgi:hypothetical protein
MLETAAATADAKAADAERTLTDGWHLVIEALKLNGIKTIYGVPGIQSRTSDVSRRPQVCASSRSGMSRTQVTPPRSPAT